MKILIIDDEEDVRRIAHLSLAHVGGHEVIEAASGAAGIDRARAERPDAILLDVMMPVMDGPATLVRLQADESTRAIPVVFVTARAMTAEIERLRSLGVCGVLIKPFDAMMLSRDLMGVLP